MVREHVTLLEIEDIRCVRVRCGNPKCHQELLIQLDKGESRLRTNCPQCNVPWYTKGSEDRTPEYLLLHALKELHAGTDSPMTIRLESRMTDSLR